MPYLPRLLCKCQSLKVGGRCGEAAAHLLVLWPNVKFQQLIGDRCWIYRRWLEFSALSPRSVLGRGGGAEASVLDHQVWVRLPPCDALPRVRSSSYWDYNWGSHCPSSGKSASALPSCCLMPPTSPQRPRDAHIYCVPVTDKWQKILPLQVDCVLLVLKS